MRLPGRVLRRAFLALDAAVNRLYGVAWNPVYQSGTLAVAMLIALLATGLYLLLFYRVGAPAASVARLAADPWLGAWIRGLHRYASDLFLIAAVLHLLRMWSQDRAWGPRTLAWVSGVLLFAVGLVCAWTGFVMAWDSFGERLARDGARLLDVLPILSEPLGRIFAGDRPVPSAFFFVNLFIHIGVPLAMGVLLWVHVSRVARPVLLPPRRVTWTIVALLTIAAVLVPAALGPAGDAFVLHGSTPLDLVAAWWLPVSERLTPAGSWTFAAALALVAVAAPRLTRRVRDPGGRWAPSVVDPRLCTGCNQCPRDCPWDAITMVPRQDDRPTLLAQVNPERCVSCGICAGSCAPMGIGPAGRTGRDQLQAARAEIIPSLKAGSIVAICCERTPASQVAVLRARGAVVHHVTCVGMLHSSVVETTLRSGAAGVLVCQCAARDCASREGPKWLHERLYNDREAELHARVDRRRVRVATLAPGESSASLAAFERFRNDVAALTAPVVDPTEADVFCEPAPVEEIHR